MFAKKEKTSKDNKQSHDGHRDRMKKRILAEGASKLSETELLEMLLYYVIPRCDTKKHAEELIDRFGSLGGVLNAHVGELSAVPGLKDSAEALFILLREVIGRFGTKKPDLSLLEPERLKRYLVDLYRGISGETVYAIYFAQDGSHVGTQLVFRGGISSARFSLRVVTEGVIRAGGNSLVLAHNHPSGSLVPSGDDVISTKRIAAHLAANDIQLIEHYIVGKDDAVGMFKLE